MAVIRGYFPTGFHSLPAPYVQAALYLPRLDLSGLVNFMIDTGADNTTLSLADVERIDLDYRRLRHGDLEPVEGIAGQQFFYSEEAIVLLRDEDSKIYVFPIKVHIPKRGSCREASRQRRLPSVLGRDITNQCTMLVDFNKGTVEFTPPGGARLPMAMRRLM